jgi:hypothetical protein
VIILGVLLGGAISLAMLGVMSPVYNEALASAAAAATTSLKPEHKEINVRAGEEFRIEYHAYPSEFATFNGPVRLIGAETEVEGILRMHYYYVFDAVEPGEAQVVVYDVNASGGGGSGSGGYASVDAKLAAIYDIHIS